MQGKIIKGIAGFYYVHIEDAGIYECKAKGIFRKDQLKPLVGDKVLIEILDEEQKKGNITKIFERDNSLIRPAVANIDQALVIFAIAKPNPNLNLLDRFLITMQKQNIKTVICFNKADLVTEEEIRHLREIYEPAGYEVHFISAGKKQGIEELKERLLSKTTTVAGPSGVGKSTLINCLQPKVQMETGSISEKIERGKHTTRHAQLIYLAPHSYIVDTPGFSSLSIEPMEKEDLQGYFEEFEQFEKECRFQGCSHTHEPSCGVKEALAEGKIRKERYDNYLQMYEECKNKRRY